MSRVRIENDGPEREATLRVRAEGVDEKVSLSCVPTGETVCDAYLPDIREPVQLRVELWAGGTRGADDGQGVWVGYDSNRGQCISCDI